MNTKRNTIFIIFIILFYLVITIFQTSYRKYYISEEEYYKSCDKRYKLFKDSVARAEGDRILGPFNWNLTRKEFDSIIDSSYAHHEAGFYLNNLPIIIDKDSCVFINDRLRRFYAYVDNEDLDNNFIFKNFGNLRKIIRHSYCPKFVHMNTHNGKQIYILPHKTIVNYFGSLVIYHPTYWSHLEPCIENHEDWATKEKRVKARIEQDTLHKKREILRWKQVRNVENQKIKLTL